MRVTVPQVILLGLLLRVLWVVLIPVQPVSDSAAYDALAQTLFSDGVYGWTASEPSAYWAVGTSAITAATFFLFGETYWGIVGLNLISSVVLMGVSWRLAYQYFGARPAYWTVVALALWPNLIFFTSILSSELYFMTLTVAGLFFWSRRQGMWWVNLLLCGLIWGLACYIRPVILLFPAAMAIAALSDGWKSTLMGSLKAAVAIGLIVAVVSPWTARNAEVMGKPFLVSSNFGTNLWMGNNPASDGGYTPLPPEVSGMSELEREDYLKDKAWAYIAEDRVRFAKTVGLRIFDLHSRETIGVAWNLAAIKSWVGDTGVLLAKALSSAYWIFLVIAALGGLVVLWSSMKLAALFHPIFGGWAYFTAVHSIIVSGDRYHMPSSPFVAILAGVCLAWVMGKFSKKETEFS